MLLEFGAPVAIVRTRISVLLPVPLHPGDDQFVVDFRRLAAEHEVDLQRLVQRHRISHLGLDRAFELQQQTRAEHALQRLPVGGLGR